MSLLEQIANELTSPKADKPKRSGTRLIKADAPKAKGFSAKSIPANLIAQAKQWHAQYQRGIGSKGYPMVGFSASSPNFYPMVVVATIPGFTSEVDALAKVQAVQSVLGAKLATRQLGLGAFGSASVPTRYGTARQVGLHLILATDAKGLRKMRPTTPRERQAYQSIMPDGTATRGAPKAKTSTKAKVSAKATAERRNGPVSKRIDPKLKADARNAERAVRRAKVAAEKAAASN